MRVVVVDDHGVFREGLAAILGSLDGVEVVGIAADGAEAIETVQALRPDVVLMDIHMPVMNGIDATRSITMTDPDVAVLVLTMLEDDASVFAAIDAGARGYLLKESGREDLARAMFAVSRGQAILDASVAGRVLRGPRDPERSDTRPDPRAFPFLTAREREILDHIARGLTNPAIASRLVLSEKTVRNHVSNIFSKLHVNDRAAAVARARDAGYGRRST
jgi:DNA-binding NarL/FixJ family response regulator